MMYATMEVHEQDVFGSEAVDRSAWEPPAMHVVRAALCLPPRARLAAAQPAAWDPGLDLLDSDDPLLHQYGLAWQLRILATTPNTGCTVAQRLLAARPHATPPRPHVSEGAVT